MKTTAFTFIDLFAGIGGFKMALANNGGKCINFSEINKDAIAAYCENYHISKEDNLGDITKIQELPKHDMLTAGVPCQSWSIAGKNLGFDDDRGQLWNDTIYLLKQSNPKAFIFENVKGLADPRNKEALKYILDGIKQVGYFANFYVINSFDYGVPQNRVRVYIVGFREKEYFDNFHLPKPTENRIKLSDILGVKINEQKENKMQQKGLFGHTITTKQMSLSTKNGFNDYFLFNDLRNGHTTIHTWDIINTTQRQKEICLTLLKNRRKSQFGLLDGNPLSLKHFKQIDANINEKELNELAALGILKKVDHAFEILDFKTAELDEKEIEVLSLCSNNMLIIDKLKKERMLKIKRISIAETVKSLLEKGVLKCIEQRYDFKNTKISSGLNGVNRVFMPSADLFPTLVASDTNDYVSLKDLNPINRDDYKDKFLKEVYFANNYRKITKEEACMIQGFPKDFILPKSRAKWMKLVGNSVSVPVINALAKEIIKTGIFDDKKIERITKYGTSVAHTKSSGVGVSSKV